jgi:hypothetical protein
MESSAFAEDGTVCLQQIEKNHRNVTTYNFAEAGNHVPARSLKMNIEDPL